MLRFMTENNKYKQIIELNPITAIEYSSCYNSFFMKRIFRFLAVCFYHRFKIIKSCDEAKKRNLQHSHNVYGDGINRYNCRSFWYDEYDFLYRCAELHV